MKQYILIALNLTLTIFLLLSVFDTKKQDLPVTTTLECLDFQGVGKSLCAQCVSRIESFNPSKGFTVHSDQKYAALKLLQKQEFINCKQSLQLIDVSNPNNPSLVFQKIPAISQLLSFLQASIVNQISGKLVVEPKYEHFIIYNWYNTVQKKGVQITFPNDNSKTIFTAFQYVVNIIIVLIMVGKLMIKSQIDNQYVNYLVVMLIVGLEYIVYQYMSSRQSYFLELVRIISLSLPLLRVQVKNNYVFAYSTAGLIMALHPLSLSIYSFIGWFLILIGGWQKLKVESVWKYLVYSQFVVSLNYLIWYISFQYEADNACKIIELTQLSINLFAFTLIGDHRVQEFKEYMSKKNKPIYLSGYDDEEEMIIIS